MATFNKLFGKTNVEEIKDLPKSRQSMTSLTILELLALIAQKIEEMGRERLWAS